MRILVTGSRDWTDEAAVHSAIDTVVAANDLPPSRVVIVHGACPAGADQHAQTWADRHLASAERHPANWNEYGQSAGFKRNIEMVDSGVDIALAFIRPCHSDHCSVTEPHGSHGASHCARAAGMAGVPVMTLAPELVL